MQLFNQNDFNEFILDHKVIEFFDKPVTLKLGRHSIWYVNWRKPSEDVALIDELSDHILDFISDRSLNPDTIYGIPEGATKIALITQYKWATSFPNLYTVGKYALAMGRGKPKEHGALEDRFFLGKPKGKTIVIEDVTTTGNSLLETIDTLKQINTEVIAAIGLTNRMEKRDDGSSVEEALNREGVNYYSLSNAFDILLLACKREKPIEFIIRSIEQEFQQYGVKPLLTLRLF